MSEIAAILDKAKLPALSRDQLLELAGNEAGASFGHALRAFAAGDTSQRDALEATVRALDPCVRSALNGLGGGAVAVEQLVAIAKQEQRRFFNAIEEVTRRSAHAAAARRYLAGLGLVPALPAILAKPAAIPPYYSFKIFGAAAALCIAEATTRSTNQHTVNIEGAAALAGAGPKTFDWPNKIVVQLTVQEAYQLLAVFENKIPAVRFDGHGRAHDKSLHIERQQTHYFVKIIQKGRPLIAVPVSPVDSLQVTTLLYRQLLANQPHLRIEDLQIMVARMVTMMPAPR